MKNHKITLTKQIADQLIELTVVLLILISLATLLIPYIDSFNKKSDNINSLSNLSLLNIAMLNRNINYFVITHNKLPDNMDNLINGASYGNTPKTGACAINSDTEGAIYCGLQNPNMFTPVTYYYDGIGAIQYESFFKSGIKSFYWNDPKADNKTFLASGLKNNVKKGECITLAMVSVYTDINNKIVSISNHLNIALGDIYDTNCYEYVAMGVGEKNEIKETKDKTLLNSPAIFQVSVLEESNKDNYNNYIAILELDKNNNSPCSAFTEKAKFIGLVVNVKSEQENHLMGMGQMSASR